ncbi:NAD(P)/FAD-dependent oxidoreductase [Thalassotalea mangrovi]|uniref:FAD-binding oxidoreductase n=1 Tax=Thalassotalea mangrovi TaxID=2572245 RepID=A0A4V5NUJ7_9GAMM|nr:FAD-dependent oxidoreductase [Thalassotalea mangrovi]TKB46735.1 FAD-binding oxidoreductase [Thalassotalea mangrovi]
MAKYSNGDAHSYYQHSKNMDIQFPRLETSVEVDVCIIGGGFTGVASAVELSERGYSVALLEAHSIGWGASGRNGGQLIRGIGHEVSKFRSQIGQSGVELINQLGVESLQVVKDRIRDYQIDCDLTLGYCDIANHPKHIEYLQQSFERLQTNGYPHSLELLDQQQVQQRVIGSKTALAGLVDMGSGHLHPLNLCLGEALAAQRLGAQIFEHSPVTQVTRGRTHRISSAKGEVNARILIYGGNAYLQDLELQLTGKVLPAGSYIIATEPLSPSLCKQLMPANFAICDQRVDLDYFRMSADKRLLFGGLCHYSGKDPHDIKAVLQPKMLKVFPQLANAKIDFQWGGMIGIGANRLPQIGRLAKNVYYAQAYSGHGLNVTHMAAKLIAEHIHGETERVEVFEQVKHLRFPGGRYLRSPLLALGMMYHKMFG